MIRFPPKKVWKGEMVCREGTEFEAAGDQRDGQRRKREALERLWLACHLEAGRGGGNQVRPFFQLSAKAHKRTVSLLHAEQIIWQSNYQLKNL